LATTVCIVKHKFADEYDVSFPEGWRPELLEEMAVAILSVFKKQGCNMGKVFRRIPGATLHNDNPISIVGNTSRIVEPP
jgi:hypothetical protein